MKVQLITITSGYKESEYQGKTLEEIIVAIARRSSPRDDKFSQPDKLLRHCIVQGHWSIFDQVHLGFEIETSRAIGRQLLRHWSIKPQEFSQRYAPVVEFEDIEIREQSKKNRQSSSQPIDVSVEFFGSLIHVNDLVKHLTQLCFDGYSKMVEIGVAREVARAILPECAKTNLVMTGSLRSWITFLSVRLHKNTQKECREVAIAIKDYLIAECPIISKTLFNFEFAYEVQILEQLILEKHGVRDQVLTSYSTPIS
jgi:thymidylate synthase (FAD)